MSAISQAFLRRPSSASEVAADVVRALTVVSVVVATVGWGAIEFAVFMLALLGTLVPRALGARGALDVATGVSCLVAAWSNVFHLYTRVIGWDKLVHGVLTGCLVALLVLIAQRIRFLPALDGHRAAHAVSATLVGLGLGSLWEMGEWAGHTFIDPGIVVGYVDTVGDLAYDGLGGLVAGLALPFLLHRDGDDDRPVSAAVRESALSR